MVALEKIVELRTVNGEQPTPEDIEYLADGDWRTKVRQLRRSGAPPFKA